MVLVYLFSLLSLLMREGERQSGAGESMQLSMID